MLGTLALVVLTLPGADREGLRSIVESLVQTTKDMEDVNLRLEERLVASKKEISRLRIDIRIRSRST